MKTRLIIVGTLFLLLSITANAKVWRVNNNAGINADFTTAQAANDGASANDTIFFEGSLYEYGLVTFDKKLIIIGPGYFLDKNENTQVSKLSAIITKATFTLGSENSTITGIDFNGKSIIVNADNISIVRCNMDYVTLGSVTKSANNTIINQCFFKGGNTGALVAYGECNNVVVTNCIIVNKTLRPSRKFHLIITNNYVSGNIDVYGSDIENNIVKGTISKGHGNTEYNNFESIVESEYFTKDNTSPDLFYTLSGSSPALNAGKDGTDCGPSGGLNPYVLSGIPKGPHIYDATISTSANKEDGLNISIKIKTQL